MEHNTGAARNPMCVLETGLVSLILMAPHVEADGGSWGLTPTTPTPHSEGPEGPCCFPWLALASHSVSWIRTGATLNWDPAATPSKEDITVCRHQPAPNFYKDTKLPSGPPSLSEIHLYICICICIYIYMCVFIYVYLHMYTHIYIDMCVCIYTNIHVSYYFCRLSSSSGPQP